MHTVLLLLSAVSLTVQYDFKGKEVLKTHKHDLVLLIMGDPQYHFKCEERNTVCKAMSKRCRETHGLEYSLHSREDRNRTVEKARLECTKIESRYANRVQRLALEKVIAELSYEPAALVIDGDLTDFGHMAQFHEFEEEVIESIIRTTSQAILFPMNPGGYSRSYCAQEDISLISGWMKNFPIPILAGLGNHDYENNINDCFANFCAHTMLTWFTNYGKNLSLEMDFTRIAKSSFDIQYTGSFAYATRVCSITGRNCAHLLQLNNAIDYENMFSSILVNWKITSPLEWLKRKLDILADMDQPILIHMHQNEGTRTLKVKDAISGWFRKNRLRAHKPRVAVFFAHMHSLHTVTTYCIDEIAVPFVHVGSVPNNRFSTFHVTDDGTSIYGWAAEKHGPTLISRVDDLWGPCNKTKRHEFLFPGEIPALFHYKQ